MSRAIFSVAAGLLASTAFALPTPESPSDLQERTIGPAGRVCGFEDIPSSPELHWTPCYGRFHCSNLQVPLDYENPSLGSTVVAWVRQDPPNSTGLDILFNPGGPGQSGINHILGGTGDAIIKLTGGKYSVAAFDPRGVNSSSTGTPLTCFPNDPATRAEYVQSSQGLGNRQETYAKAAALGKFCTAANNNTTARYASTMAVVQDMMHYTELRAANDGKNPKEALLYYYGVSYGTVIGQTLAAQYPDRIGRIVVDGNVNAENHYKGNQEDSLQDADGAMRYFFKLCHEAGQEKCPFAGKSGSAQDLENRFNTILQKLEKEPLQSTFESPAIITKTMALQKIILPLYTPLQSFPMIAVMLDALEKGNATAYFEAATPGGAGGEEKDEEDGEGEKEAAPKPWTNVDSNEALSLITVLDAAGRDSIKTFDAYSKTMDTIMNSSKWFGEHFGKTNAVQYAGYSLSPPKSQLMTGFKKTKTKNPVLFINTLWDPVTPLAAAKHMSQYFEGSSVLVQNSAGHGLLSVPSACTMGHFKEYFDTGKVPKDGTVCEVSKKPLVDKIEQLGKRDVDFWPRFI